MLPPDRWDAWLDPGTDAATASGLLAVAPPALLTTAVGTAVNRVGSDGPELLSPAPAGTG